MLTIVISSTLILGIMGAFFGAVLAYASQIFAVEIDPRIEKIASILPNANCGACGAVGCMAFAERVAAGDLAGNLCKPGGKTTAQGIGEILGKDMESGPQMRAVVLCKGGDGIAKTRYVYDGIEDCTAAHILSGGNKFCEYGCLGLGTCVRACPFDAMEMGIDKLPNVFESMCTACGLCVQACPRGIMQLLPLQQRIYVACVSHDKGKFVNEICSKGCNACGLCANPKTTPSGEVTMVDNLPQIKFINNRNLVAGTYRCPKDTFANDVKFSSLQITEQCIGCPDEKKPPCVKACPVTDCVIRVTETGKYTINQETCISCLLCVPVCPVNAIPYPIEENVSVEIS